MPGVRFDFNKAAQKIAQDHPRMKHNTIFIDLSTGERHGSLITRARAYLSSTFRKLVKSAKEKASKAHIRGSAHTMRNEAGYYGVAMTTDKPYEFLAGPNVTDEMDQTFAFRHEVGHVVVPVARPGIGAYFEKLFGKSYTTQESAADAYAVLRHIMEYGKDDKSVDNVPLRRAMDFINNDWPEYATTFTVDAILADREMIARANMKPEHAVEAAERYVKMVLPTREQIDAMREDFKPLKGELYKVSRTNLEPFRKLADIALDPKSSPMTFYLANRVLGRFMGPVLNGADWVVIAHKLEEKAKTVNLETLFPNRKAAMDNVKGVNAGGAGVSKKPG